MKAAYRWLSMVVKGFLESHSSMHAAGLTYFSMLAIVPILCILLLAAKTFKADHLVRPHIDKEIDSLITYIETGQEGDEYLVQLFGGDDEQAHEARKTVASDLGHKARQLSNTVFERVDKLDLGTLGWIGFAALAWTVISSISMVEESFNEIWGVPKPRAIWKRGLMYLSVVIILPVIGALAMSLPILNMAKNVIIATLGATWLTQWVSTGLIWFLDSWIFRTAITLTFASLDFAFLFAALPNCRVDFKAALKGGALTGILLIGWMKACTVAQIGVARSSALYGSFAFFPIVLAWIYMSWQILLLGANMVHAFEKLEDAKESEKTDADGKGNENKEAAK